MTISVGFNYCQNTDGTCEMPQYGNIDLHAPNGLEEIGTKLVKAIRQTCLRTLEGLARARFIAPDTERVYPKYVLLDGKTLEEKRGNYFCLKIDSSDPMERQAVRSAMSRYAEYWEQNGRADFAKNIREWIERGGKAAE